MSNTTLIGMLNARSVSDKTIAIYDRIVADRLHLCAVIETWHDTAYSPQLITCTPPGYSYIEKASPRTKLTMLSTRTNQGRLCLFYALFLSAREVPLPVYKSGLEALTVYLRGAGRNALAVVVYRPPDTSISAFFDDLADILEGASMFACPVILMGDVNIHLDVVNDPHAINWRCVMDSHGLTRHVTSPTHQQGHILDVIVIRSDCPVTDVRIELPTLSDHAYITFGVDLQFSRRQSAGSVRRRQWRRFDYDEFCHDLCQSDLLSNPPTDVASLVTCYDETLLSLLDKHAPFADIKRRAHVNAPWYDRQCRLVKVASSPRARLPSQQDRHQP